MKGKVACVPFKSHFDSTDHPLQVVHSDLVGPITPLTNSGAFYFITLVDQHTGFISITLLKRQLEATEAILDFKTFYKKQTGFSMKKLITNGGREFCNCTLLDTLKSHGIQHNVAPPYTPQHNRIAERENETIINMARCMLVQTRLAKEWWGEAVCTAALTTNCIPSLGKSTISPLEQLTKKIPNMALFQPFGCKTWVIKPPQKQTSKFDAIAWNAILLGYSNNYSCYRFIKLDSMYITDTTDTYFDDSTFPPLRALNPSLDFSPHPLLPNFSSTDLPFDDDDNSCLPEPSAPLPPGTPPPHKDEVMRKGDDSSCDKEPLNLSVPRQHLVLCLGPHPTCRVDSNIDPTNILSRQTCSAAAFSVTSTKPSNHCQAMACDDCNHWKLAEQTEIKNMLKHNV
jgi:hypothetical protein